MSQYRTFTEVDKQFYLGEPASENSHRAKIAWKFPICDSVAKFQNSGVLLEFALLIY